MVVPICLDCGCHAWADSHGDADHLTRETLNKTLLANSATHLTKAQIAANIKDGIDAWLANEADATKAAAGTQGYVHPGGYRYSVTIEPSE